MEWLSLFNVNLQSLAHLPTWGQLYKVSAGLLSFSLRLILLGAICWTCLGLRGQLSGILELRWGRGTFCGVIG